jgi:Fe-Mn family superoxide dismutase
MGKSELIGRFELPPLPWPSNALDPVISKAAVELHHEKHHRGYIDKLNKLVEGTEFAEMPLEEVVRATSADPSQRKIFNNAGQAWNHTFFFHGLKAPGKAAIPKPLQALIDKQYGNADAMLAELVKAAVERFGSGWAWLGLSGKKLEISSTSNADTLLTTDVIPLFTLDVWEHAYYLDYHERREAYAKAALSMLVDWDVVARRGGLL